MSRIHKPEAIERLKHHRLIPVIRAHSADDAIWGATRLIEAGFGVMEITYSTPKTPLVIEMLHNDFPQVLFGAGTVTTAQQADSALNAGASFLASPALQFSLLDEVLAQEALLIPGVMTPTEMLQATDRGAELLKVFPAQSIGGASFLKSVLGPMPELQLVPTGGIGLDNFTDYLAAGAVAVGLGSHLAPPDVLAERDTATLQQRAEAYLQQLSAYDQRALSAPSGAYSTKQAAQQAVGRLI